MDRPVRIDSYLWAVRIFKTRAIAQSACKKGRVSVNDAAAKPAKMVAPGDVISVRKPPVTFSFKVLQTAKNRMGAKMVPEYIQNVTPSEQYELLELNRISGYVDRMQGLGRPTKKERRDLEQFFEMPEDLVPDDDLSPEETPEAWDEDGDGDDRDWDNW